MEERGGNRLRLGARSDVKQLQYDRVIDQVNNHCRGKSPGLLEDKRRRDSD
jgi:hypothetical protein